MKAFELFWGTQYAIMYPDGELWGGYATLDDASLDLTEGTTVVKVVISDV